MQYTKFVKPAFDDFVLPSKKYADVIIPRGGDNHVAIDLIVQHIRTKLGQHDLCKIYPNVFVIQSTFQVHDFIYFFIDDLSPELSDISIEQISDGLHFVHPFCVSWIALIALWWLCFSSLLRNAKLLSTDSWNAYTYP